VRRANVFLEQFRKLREKQAGPPGAEIMADQVRQSLEEKQYARLRRQLGSYAVRKTEERTQPAKDGRSK
jgi:hypothetical protein